MRCLGFGAAAVVVIMTVPPTDANAPLGPCTIQAVFEGDPRVGGEIEMLVTVETHWTDGPLHFGLDVPDWVKVASSPNWTLDGEPGKTSRRAWVLTAQQEGAWMPVLSHPPTGSGNWRCGWWGVAFWSSTDDGWSAQLRIGERLFPEGGADVRLTAKEVQSDVWNLTYRVTPSAPWLRSANMTATLRSQGDPPFAVSGALSGVSPTPLGSKWPFRMTMNIPMLLRVRLLWYRSSEAVGNLSSSACR